MAQIGAPGGQAAGSPHAPRSATQRHLTKMPPPPRHPLAPPRPSFQDPCSVRLVVLQASSRALQRGIAMPPSKVQVTGGHVPDELRGFEDTHVLHDGVLEGQQLDAVTQDEQQVVPGSARQRHGLRVGEAAVGTAPTPVI